MGLGSWLAKKGVEKLLEPPRPPSPPELLLERARGVWEETAAGAELSLLAMGQSQPETSDPFLLSLLT
jgi:hypothetical protein